MDSTNWLRIPHIFRGFRIFACFWSNFEQCRVLAICPSNPKQQRRSNKKVNVADCATNLILACCAIRLQFTKCTVWPRNDSKVKCKISNSGVTQGSILGPEKFARYHKH